MGFVSLMILWFAQLSIMNYIYSVACRGLIVGFGYDVSVTSWLVTAEPKELYVFIV